MNSILRRASGKDMTPRPRRQSLLTRGTWKNLLALAVVALLSAVSAFANDSKQIGIQGINGPRGMILAHIPNPAVAGGVIQDYWVTDSVLGFCRLDNGILNAGTCDPNGTFEPL